MSLNEDDIVTLLTAAALTAILGFGIFLLLVTARALWNLAT